MQYEPFPSAEISMDLPAHERRAVRYLNAGEDSLLARLAHLRLDPIYRKPRFWSNMILRNIAPHFAGRVVNCSGWADEDKFGSHYRHYFTGATEYAVTNYSGGAQQGSYTFLENSYQLDLEKALPSELRQRFEVVYSHTVLEHVFDVSQAVRNICEMSTDAAIVVIPWTQLIHVMEDKFGDYWRFTPECLERMFAVHGMMPVCHHGTDIPGSSVYYASVFSRTPDKYAQLRNSRNTVPNGDDMYTSVRWRSAVRYLLGR